MAFTNQQITENEKAIASTAQSVSFEGRSVTTRSVDELLKARKIMRDDVSATAGKSRVRVIKAYMDKGF